MQHHSFVKPVHAAPINLIICGMIYSDKNYLISNETTYLFVSTALMRLFLDLHNHVPQEYFRFWHFSLPVNGR
jgi:hypothetical protein